MDYHLADAEEGSAKESLLLLRDMVGEQIRTKPRYRCHKCGSPPTHSIGIARLAVPGHQLSRSED